MKKIALPHLIHFAICGFIFYCFLHLCDNAPEQSTSAFMASKILWGLVFSGSVILRHWFAKKYRI